jgi:hypothetical protein
MLAKSGRERVEGRMARPKNLSGTAGSDFDKILI